MTAKAGYNKKDACIAAGFTVEGNTVLAYGQTFPLADPLAIHLKTYRTNSSHETRYQAMKAAFDILWPQHSQSYNYWMERIFREHCNHDTEVFTLAAGGGIGKAGRETSLVRTPTGWVQMKNIKVGDTICSTNSTTQTVLGVYPQGIRPIYKVTLSDGTSTECDEDHLWTVYSAKQRDHKSSPQTITTRALQANLHKNFSLPNYTAVQGVYTPFVVHPYLLGILLGNGSLNEESVSVHIQHKDHADRLREFWEVSSIKKRPGCFRVGFRGLRKYVQRSVSHTKYIPPEYLTASIEQRTHLLQGLLDTDGTCSKSGTASYSTVSKQLALDVADLARGLGLLVTTHTKLPRYTYKGTKKTGRLSYTVIICRTNTTKDLQLFTAPHKLARSHTSHRQYTHRRVIKVEYVEHAPAICIKVSDPSELYLTDDYIVTHNTQTAAYIACLFWLALPNKRAVIVTSTTLASLKSRIYGYILRALKEMAVPMPFTIRNTPPPSIQCSPPDDINGIYGVAAKQGADEDAIKEIIGRHPKNALLLILDEAPDMPVAIMNAIPNLKKSLEDRFQAIAIGNAASITDLHGALSTPKVGWDNIDPRKDYRWQTTQPNGVCLYFNPYDSPAIHEPDPVKKQILSRFLITEDKLIEAERSEGVDSEAFWRFTMGFWRSRSTDKTIVSEAFLKDYDPTRPAEFSGKLDLHIVAGLDPAFSVGGDKCILRLAVLGHHTNGKMVLDYRGEHFVFLIKIMANTGKSAEIQIADQVIAICQQYNVKLNTLCVDASGQGRGLADVIQLRSGGALTPTKIYSTNLGTRNVQSFDTVISSAHEMWFKGREFISNGQIFGLDALAYGQLHTRLIIEKGGKKLLEKKDEYKKRMASISTTLGRSPDEADAAMLALQSAILHYGFFPGQQKANVTYADEDSRRFDLALKAHREAMHPSRPFVLKGEYAKGIESLINKRMF